MNRPKHPLASVAAAFLSLLGSVSAASAVTQLKRGNTPPPITLSDTNGHDFSLENLRDHAVILLFGELYHPKTIEACRQLQDMLADPRLSENPPHCALIVAQQTETRALLEEGRRQRITIQILHDRSRAVFDAYQVSVLPSIVVLDRKGKVAYAAASLSSAFREITTDAALYASGRLSLDQFERTVHPPREADHSKLASTAARLTELALQLGRRGRYDLAVEKFNEALKADAAYLPARIGLGQALLQRRNLAEAEKQFRAALAIDPKSLTAGLGLASLQIVRGGSELPRAERSLRALLNDHPNEAEAYYWLGRVCEQSGRVQEATASFRKAAELSLERGPESSEGGSP